MPKRAATTRAGDEARSSRAACCAGVRHGTARGDRLAGAVADAQRWNAHRARRFSVIAVPAFDGSGITARALTDDVVGEFSIEALS